MSSSRFNENWWVSYLINYHIIVITNKWMDNLGSTRECHFSHTKTTSWHICEIDLVVSSITICGVHCDIYITLKWQIDIW
jgi:hypothetical protein